MYFSAGGATIYAQTIPLADTMYLSLVKGTFDGDTYSPPFEESEWPVERREDSTGSNSSSTSGSNRGPGRTATSGTRSGADRAVQARSRSSRDSMRRSGTSQISATAT